MLTSRFDEAFLYASRLHAHQTRKSNQIPYISHLMSVAALVLETGGNEDQAIAALLHDAVEDQGGLATLEDIRQRFGDRVAWIVDGCTDAYTIPKPDWQERKAAYLKRLETADAEVCLVSLADKVHNARTILFDLRKEGASTWARFKGGKEGTLWYYRNLVKVFREKGSSLLLDELVRVVTEIDRLADM